MSLFSDFLCNWKLELELFQRAFFTSIMLLSNNIFACLKKSMLCHWLTIWFKNLFDRKFRYKLCYQLIWIHLCIVNNISTRTSCWALFGQVVMPAKIMKRIMAFRLRKFMIFFLWALSPSICRDFLFTRSCCIPEASGQMLPFSPDAESSEEESSANVKKSFFSIFMIRFLKECPQLVR